MLVIPTDEEVAIARQVRALLGRRPQPWSTGLARSAVVEGEAPGSGLALPHDQLVTSGMSSPCSRVHALARCRRSPISCRSAAACEPSEGTRSMTSMTRWKRSRSFIITMSNGVVVVPSSL